MIFDDPIQEAKKIEDGITLLFESQVLKDVLSYMEEFSYPYDKGRVDSLSTKDFYLRTDHLSRRIIIKSNTHPYEFILRDVKHGMTALRFDKTPVTKYRYRYLRNRRLQFQYIYEDENFEVILPNDKIQDDFEALHFNCLTLHGFYGNLVYGCKVLKYLIEKNNYTFPDNIMLYVKILNEND